MRSSTIEEEAAAPRRAIGGAQSGNAARTAREQQDGELGQRHHGGKESCNQTLDMVNPSKAKYSDPWSAEARVVARAALGTIANSNTPG
jgi:hypothetical protein